MNETLKEIKYSLLLLFGLLISLAITVILPLFIISYLNIKIIGVLSIFVISNYIL
ncbi:hypothetical protein SAMN05443634_1031, partial [Chishuiella changwenlii]